MNILDRKRRTTDKKVLGLFIIFVILWISIAIYAYSSGDSTQILPNYTNSAKKLFNVSRIFVTVSYILLAGVYTTLIFIGMQWTSNFSLFSLTTLWIAPAVTISLVIIKTHFATVSLAIASFYGCILTYTIVSLEWLHLPERILKESRKLIMFFPTAILFAVICCCFCILITVFTITTHLYLNTIQEDDDSLPGHIVFFMIVNVLVWSWLFFFAFNFWTMTFSGTIATWFLNGNKTVTASNIFLRCLKFTTRYHLGTVAFSSSIFGPGKMHRMMIVHMIKRFREGTANVSFILFVLCNIFHPIVLNFTVPSAMMMCAIDGTDFHESLKKSLDYFVKYPRKCLIVIKSAECMTIYILAVTSFLLLISFYCYRDFLSPLDEETHRWNIIFFISIAFGSMIFVGPLIAILYVAYIAILLCVFEDSERNYESKEKSYVMSAELRTSLLVSNPPDWCRKGCICCRFLTRTNTFTIANV